MEAEGENVIYVQVDEHGRVLNYTTNMPGGEQVILLQEGGDEGNQQVMYQPQQLVGEQQQIIQPAPAQPTTQIIQAPDSSIQASNLMQDPTVQAQIMAQASSDAMVIQASAAPVVNSASKIIETAFSQATNEVPPTAQATIIDGSGNRILVADESQIPMQLMTTSSSAPIILSNEQAQILIAGTSQQQQQRRSKPVQQRTTPTIVAGKGNRLGRSLISPAARTLVATQRSAIQVTSPPRSLPAALQPSPQQILVSAPNQTATTSVSASMRNKDAMAAFESVENLVMDELVAGRSQDSEEVVRLEEAQELSDHVNAEEQVSQAERDLLQAAKEEQEKQDKLDATDVPMPQDDMLQIDENPNAANQNAEDNIAVPNATETAGKVLNQDQTNILIPEADIPMPEQQSSDQQDEQTPQEESTAPTTDVSEQPQVSLSSEPVVESQITTDSAPAEISVSLAKPEEMTEADQVPESSAEQTHDQSIDEAAQLNGNIFANDEEDMETDEQIQAVVVATVPVQQAPAGEQVQKDNETEEEKQPSQDIGETYAKIMELSNKFDNKYAEITGTQKPAVGHETLYVAAKDKPVKKILVASHVSKIVPRDRKDDNDTDGGKDITESDDDFEFKPQGVGRPKKTYEGIASRKRQSSENKQDTTLNQSIAERRARRKIKPSTRNIDMSDMKADSTEEDTEDEGLIIEPDKPAEKRGRGRPRKYPQEPKPGITSSIIITPGTAVISPGKAIQVTSAHMSPPRTIITPKTVNEAMSNKAATVSSPVASPKPTVKDGESPKPAAVDSEKRGRGRPRKVDAPAVTATPGSSTEQQPDVTSSSDQFSDADPAQKSFMASFSLMTAAQRAAKEEESKRRRSKRVSQAEQKAKEDEEEEEAKEQEQETEKKSDNIFDIFDTPKVDPIGEIQSLRDDVDDLKDVNSQLLSKLSTTEADTDVKSLQAKVRKLQTVNAELKTRLRTYETKSASTKFTDRNEIKSLQAKVEKLNTQNTDLKSKVTDMELSRVAVPQTVDKKGVVHKLKSPRSGRHVDKTPTKMGGHDLEEWDAELQARTEALDKKEQKLKILDRELDERTAMLKAKEGKLGRSVQQLKTKERELEYREKQMERSANQSQTDQKSKQEMEHQLELRDVAIEEKEKELEVRENLLGTTEQQLQALGQELKEKFEYLQNSGQDVSEARAELENQMAESAAKVKATTTALSRSAEKVKKPVKKRADSPASSRGSTKGSTKGSTPAQVKQRRDSGRSQSSDTRKGAKPNSKSRRSVAKPRKYSPSPEPKRAKGTPRTPFSPKTLNSSIVNGTPTTAKKTPKNTPKAKDTNGHDTPKTAKKTPKTKDSNGHDTPKTAKKTPKTKDTNGHDTPKTAKKTPKTKDINGHGTSKTPRGSKSTPKSKTPTAKKESKAVKTPKEKPEKKDKRKKSESNAKRITKKDEKAKPKLDKKLPKAKAVNQKAKLLVKAATKKTANISKKRKVLTEIKPKVKAMNGVKKEKMESEKIKTPTDKALSVKEMLPKALKKVDGDEKDGGAGKGKDDQKKPTEDSKSTRVSVGKRARRESSPNPQAAKKKKV